MDKVSVIVPVYKVEQYLKRCIESLINQTYKNIEIILVEDGSPDSSGKICDEFAAVDSRVVAVHQENKGVSAARNHGLQVMSGRWVCFCDGDDWYDSDFVEKMVKTAEENSADYIICEYKIVQDENTPVIPVNLNLPSDGATKREVIALGPTPSCTHMIEKRLFEISNAYYPEGCRQSEELPVIPVTAKYANKIALLKEPLYNYYQRGAGSSASNMAVASEENFRKCFKIMCERLGDEYKTEAEYHAVYALLYGEVLKLCKNKAKSKEIKSKIESFEKEFPNYMENPYLESTSSAKRIFIRFANMRFILGLRLLSWVHSKIVK